MPKGGELTNHECKETKDFKTTLAKWSSNAAGKEFQVEKQNHIEFA
jgi:hypothetical protein